MLRYMPVCARAFIHGLVLYRCERCIAIILVKWGVDVASVASSFLRYGFAKPLHRRFLIHIWRFSWQPKLEWSFCLKIRPKMRTDLWIRPIPNYISSTANLNATRQSDFHHRTSDLYKQIQIYSALLRESRK